MCNIYFIFKYNLEGPDSVTLSPPSPGPQLEGVSIIVTCVAECTPTCEISWTLREQVIVPNSQLDLIIIKRSQTGNVYTCTATNTVTHKSKTKEFTLTVYCEY